MPFNGSGTYSRLYSWAVDAVNNVNISSSRTDAEMNGFAAGLTNCVTRDGQSPPSADLPMGGKKLVNLGLATTSTDALSQAAGDARYVLASGATNLTLTGALSSATGAFSGNVTVGGTLGVTGASTLAAVTATTITASAAMVGTTLHLTSSIQVDGGVTLGGPVMTLNTNLLFQHNGTDGFIRTQSGALNLGAGGNNYLNITAAGAISQIGTGAFTIGGAASFAALTASGLISGTNGLSITGAVSLTGALTTGTAANSLGYLGAPSAVKTANYALATTDIGQDITFNGTTLTCTIPAGLPNGYVAIIANINASALTITSASDTLTLSGTTTTGNRTLGQNGEARIIRRNGVLYIAGTALS